MTAMVQNLFSILWSVYMVRAWLRPPADCFHCAAVRLPAIFIWAVSVATWRRKDRRMCACIDLRSEPSGGERENGPRTFESKQGVESVKHEHKVDGVFCIAKRCGQRIETTGKTCRWHSSLDNTDRLFFLITLVVIILYMIAILIITPYRQGYYWYN